MNINEEENPKTVSEKVSLDNENLEKDIDNNIQFKTKTRKKERSNKNDNNSEGERKEEQNKVEDQTTRRARRRKNRNGSLTSEETAVKLEDKKKKKKRKVSDSRTQLLASDTQLATTLKGLEDDLYSLSESPDLSTLSPSPLIPPISPSQPVSKVYLEKKGGFSKSIPSLQEKEDQGKTPIEKDTIPKDDMAIRIGLKIQKIFRAYSIFCHGILAGIAIWQVFVVFTLHNDALDFVSLYSPLSQPLQIVFYLLTMICTVSVMDRYDVAQISAKQFWKLVSFQSGAIAVFIYWAALLLTLATNSLDDKLSLHRKNTTIFQNMPEMELQQQLGIWRMLSASRSVAVVLGWLVISLKPSTDLLYKHLKALKRWKKCPIETVRMQALS